MDSVIEFFLRPCVGTIYVLPVPSAGWLPSSADQVIDFQLDTLQAARRTYGHRSLNPEPIELTDASLESYIEQLRKINVIVDQEERRDRIELQITRL